jgi:uncharacterized protein YdeI (YjbR/CyaY-like superfamily)
MASKKTNISAASPRAQTNPKVDGFLRIAKTWQEEMTKLRAIILDCQLDEDLKWRSPCYTYQGSNVVLIHCFKEYCAILFFKGALLKDPKRLLAQPGSTQAARQLRFRNIGEINSREATVKAYIREAIEVEKAGLKVQLKKTSDIPIPAEFKARLEQSKALKAAFGALTPGRQRGYIMFFSSAKQPQTRESRIEKWMPQILRGKGLDD